METLTKLTTAMRVGGVLVLVGFALKRNHDWYVAESKLLNTELELVFKELECICKNAKIRGLEKELKELKTKYEVKEEEA